MLVGSLGKCAFAWLDKMGGGRVPSNNNWLDPLVVVVCLLVAFVLNQVLPSRSSRRRGSWVPSNNNWLDPLIVVVCLLLSQLVFGGPLTRSVVCLALLAFIVSALLLNRSDRNRNRHRPGQTALSRLDAERSRVLVRWRAIVAVLLFFAPAKLRGEVVDLLVSQPTLSRLSAECSRVLMRWVTIVAVLRGEVVDQRLSAACLRVLMRWVAIVAGLLFLGFAFDTGALFSRKVLLTWFIVTPMALCLSKAARLRTR
jgi:hypothetical protein